MPQDEMAKVKLSNADGDVETVWAFRLGKDLYRLDSSPWYAYGVSWKDVIEARPREPGDLPEFVRVVEKSGHRTIRVILRPPTDESPESQAVLAGLRELRCSYEGANRSYIAVDVPSLVQLEDVRQFLISTGQQWEHADPPYEELFPDGDAL